mgnify:CR=1 FL=1|jgi:proteasome lid subunit RPN8/RPN11
MEHLAVLDDTNTPLKSNIAVNTIDNKHYYQGKEISVVSHTHTSGPDPSDEDIEAKFKYCSHSIYYNGAFYPY